MRICKIYNCPHVEGRICCKDCVDKCIDQCLNSPDRCKCVGEGAVERVHSTKVDAERVIELAKRGRTNKEIAEEVGCSPSHVSYITTNAGLRRRRVAYKGGDGRG